MDDRIKVKGVTSTAVISASPWTSIDGSNHPVEQPIVVSIDLQHNLQAAGESDDLSHSINYSEVSKLVQAAYLPTGTSSATPASVTPYEMTERILENCLKGTQQLVSRLDLEVDLPKAVLRAKSAYVKLSWMKDAEPARQYVSGIKELLVYTIIGIHPHERKDKQPVVISLEVGHAAQPIQGFNLNLALLERRISDFVEASAYLTVEALASNIAQECFKSLESPEAFRVTITVAKPAALRVSGTPEIRVTRSLSDFPSLKPEPRSHYTTEKTFAALALGSNLGDRFQNIELALRHLENHKALQLSDTPDGELQIIDTSFLYESAPMYVENQPAFINCACLVETTLSPHDLLRVCKHIERIVGRVPSERFGPRAIDLDIVTFGEQIVDTRAPEDRNSLDNVEGQLVIPHPRMAEREFVLRPLRDIIPEWVHPQLHLSIRSLLARLQLDGPSPMHKVVPFPFSPEIRAPTDHKTPATQSYWVLPEQTNDDRSRAQRRYIMATLNVTPDSFSDGAQHNSLSTALLYARSTVSSGADIVDIGGYSTRPNAAFVSPSEEIARVVPIIHAIRRDADVRVRNVLISVDTFRVEVARAAIEAGANCVNDVYAFSGGPEYYSSPPPSSSTTSVLDLSDRHFAEMKALARETGVPVVMMHSRGDAGAHKDYSQYTPPEIGVAPPNRPHSHSRARAVVDGVRVELGRKVFRATRGAGALRRWQVFVDPGVGFSKDVEGNLELLKNAAEIVGDAYLPPYISTLVYEEGEGEGEEGGERRISRYGTRNWNPLAGFPLLIGASRKSFLGTLISQPFEVPDPDYAVPSKPNMPSQDQDQDQREKNPCPCPSPGAPPARPASDRDFATAAAITCAIQQGAAVVRVHAVQEMIDVVKIAVALCP